MTGQADDSIRIVECSTMSSVEMLESVYSPAGAVLMMVKELLQTVPRPDFIEIRAIRYEVKEDGDERPVSPVPPG